MAISVGLARKAKSIEGVEGWPYRAVAEAMEVIPRTLVQNCGGNAIRVLTELRVRSFSVVRGRDGADGFALRRLSTRRDFTSLVSMGRRARWST